MTHIPETSRQNYQTPLKNMSEKGGIESFLKLPIASICFFKLLSKKCPKIINEGPPRGHKGGPLRHFFANGFH